MEINRFLFVSLGGLRAAELNLLNEICFGLLWFKIKTLSFIAKLLRAKEKYQDYNLSLKGEKNPT